MELTAGELARLAHGVLEGGRADARVTTWSIDSRTLEPGACFVALTAARDGHDFVPDAVARGATVVLAARAVPGAGEAAVVVVDDPLAALGRLGAHARDQLSPARVVGVTGSAGKTSTKDLLAAALRDVGPVHASPGSYNNEAGVPLTLLAAPPGTDAVVLEMGARAHGDVAALCAVARPTAGVITNIGMAHAGPLGGRAGIARAKGELFEALPSDGVAVLDADDAAADGLAARTVARVLRVSARGTEGSHVRARDVSLDAELRPSFVFESEWGSAPVRLSVHGDHQVVNALLAATVALDAGVSPVAVAEGLEGVRPAVWRMEVFHAADGVLVLHDAYNANPSSTEVALRALAQIATDGRRVAVLGEMLELGAHSEEEHARIGRMVAELGIDELVAVGPEAAPLAAAARAGDVGVEVVADAPAALEALLATIGPGDAVLVKGSRAVGLEQVAHALGAGGRPVIALLVALAVAFVLSILGTPLLIRILERNGIGQQIRDDGPFAHPHVAKAGTPTMGGIAIVGSAVIGYLVAHIRTEQIRFARAGLTLMALIVGMAVVGFIDDYLGVRRARNLGLRKRGKTAGELLVAAGFAILALQYLNVSTHLSFTRVLDLDLGTSGWFVLAMLVIYASTNGVNFADGLDGLAAGTAAMVFAAFVVIAFWQFRHPGIYHVLPAASLDLAVISAAMFGACAGFLWWNAAPARVFMGDVGALALGAAMGGLALFTQTVLLLGILGGIYLIEGLSVIAQVISFKLFHFRVLRMAPIHHHFEVGGWPEFTVIVRFWLISALCVAVALGIFYADFINIPGALDR